MHLSAQFPPVFPILNKFFIVKQQKIGGVLVEKIPVWMHVV